MSNLNQAHIRPVSNVSSAGITNAVSTAVIAMTDTLLLWNRRATERHQLRGMPNHLLADIGIDRLDAVHEADKPFWQA